MTTMSAEYMREYRAATGNPSGKARQRAMLAAMAWVIKEHPEKWRELLAEARKEYGLPTERGPRSFTKPIEHGTSAGARAERYRGLKPCPPCLDAERTASRNRMRRRRANR